jgi:hypothetical protein
VERDEAVMRGAHSGEQHSAKAAVAQAARDLVEGGGALEVAVGLHERPWLIEDVAKVGALDDAQWLGHGELQRSEAAARDIRLTPV